uniref:RING-type domain-containing protein n=1 Tax=Acrobeloides nanus TaxID=290746 RepID=A0A914CDT0_9BILA
MRSNSNAESTHSAISEERRQQLVRAAMNLRRVFQHTNQSLRQAGINLPTDFARHEDGVPAEPVRTRSDPGSPRPMSPVSRVFPSSSTMHMNNMGVYNRSISHGNQNNGATVIQIEDDHQENLPRRAISFRRNSESNNNQNGIAGNADGANGESPNGSEDEAQRDARRILTQELRRIENLFRGNGNEVPSPAFGIFFIAIIVLLLALIQHIFENITGFIALVVAFLHYQDASRFMRYISGSGNIWLYLLNIFGRNFINIYLLQKHIVFKAAIFQEQISMNKYPTFFGTIYVVVLAELFVMDIILALKMIISKLPLLEKTHKRRAYQWLEYTSSVYRFAIPVIQWFTYFDSIVISVIYIVVKLIFGVPVGLIWLRTTGRLFQFSHLGTCPTQEETHSAEHCTICFGEFTSPIKLKCGHIFCSECIRTWLDKEVTCPVCRAVVTKEDNSFKNGSTVFPMHVF